MFRVIGFSDHLSSMLGEYIELCSISDCSKAISIADDSVRKLEVWQAVVFSGSRLVYARRQGNFIKYPKQFIFIKEDTAKVVDICNRMLEGLRIVAGKYLDGFELVELEGVVKLCSLDGRVLLDDVKDYSRDYRQNLDILVFALDHITNKPIKKIIYNQRFGNKEPDLFYHKSELEEGSVDVYLGDFFKMTVG